MKKVREAVSQGSKQPYERPEITRVKLVRSELAAVGCKTPMTTMGPAVGCVRFGACRMPGS
jgi:hypothetical protein